MRPMNYFVLNKFSFFIGHYTVNEGTYFTHYEILLCSANERVCWMSGNSIWGCNVCARAYLERCDRISVSQPPCCGPYQRVAKGVPLYALRFGRATLRHAYFKKNIQKFKTLNKTLYSEPTL